jgi:hypothetical protein
VTETGFIRGQKDLEGSLAMKAQTLIGLALGALALAGSGPALHAQSYSIDWYKVAGGGGTSAGGGFSVSGTIGQHDAGNTMSGGVYSLTTGFWSLVAAVQAPGLPNLTIARLSNGIVVSWPNTGSYALQQSPNLAAGNWTASGYSITTANGTNSITLTPPSGNLFFRLRQ